MIPQWPRLSPSASRTARAPPRCGEFSTTAHGVVQTPAFMPVGTQGAVKGALPPRPGRTRRGDHPRQHVPSAPAAGRRADRAPRRPAPVHRLGPADPHRQRRLPGVLPRRAPDDRRRKGIRFRSHLDGSDTPADAGEGRGHPGEPRLRHRDGARRVPRATRRRATRRPRRWSGPLRWARRCRERFLTLRGSGQPPSCRATAPIVTQSRAGAVRHRAGRRLPGPPCGERRGDGRASASRPTPLAGSASASRSDVDVRRRRRDHAAACRTDQPRYLMGTGTPLDLVECVARGIDMFDCVMPTRNARNGQLFTSEGRLNIKNARYADDSAPARSRPAPATLAGTSPGPTCGISTSPARLGQPPLTRCITSTFTLTRCGGSERL